MDKEIVGSIIGCVSFLVCALCLMGFGIYALKSKNPINFWAGDKIPPEKITDIKKYNRANGIMWLTYGALFLSCCVITFFNDMLAGMVCMGLAVAGIPALIFIYICIIKKKYFIKED